MNDQAREAEDKTLLAVLGKYVSPTRAQSVLLRARREATGMLPRSGPSGTQLLARLAEGLRMFIGEAETRAAVAELTRALSTKTADAIELDIKVEPDIARARMAARDVCQAVGTSALVLQKVATIVSELARNMVLYAGGGKLTIRQCTSGRRCLHVSSKDTGPGIKNLTEILSGKYKSRSGLGLGILGTKRLADKFDIQTSTAGTYVEAEVNY